MVSLGWIHSDNTLAILFWLRCCEELSKNQPGLRRGGGESNKKTKTHLFTVCHASEFRGHSDMLPVTQEACRGVNDTWAEARLLLL